MTQKAKPVMGEVFFDTPLHQEFARLLARAHPCAFDIAWKNRLL
jgi:hypothetical protein